MFLKVYFLILDISSPIEKLKTINPGAGHLPGSLIPTPGNLPKKCLCPGVSPGGGGMGTAGID